LFSVLPRWAAAGEAAMFSLFTVLIWVPAVITRPELPSNWVEVLYTFALAGACWVVAERMPAGAGRGHQAVRWLAGRAPAGEGVLNPGNGKYVEIYFNPEAGERRYREQEYHE
jgi:hypothetical protein